MAMEESVPPFCQAFVGLSLLLFVFDIYTKYRQLRRSRSMDPPEETCTCMSMDQSKLAMREQTEKLRKGMFRSAAKLVETLVHVLWLGPMLWGAATRFHRGIFWQAITWQIMLELGTPLSTYLMMPEEHTKLTIAIHLAWASVRIVCTAVAVKWGGTSGCLCVWAILHVVRLVLPFAQFVPMAFGFSPFVRVLDDKALRAKIDNMARAQGFPLAEIYLYDTPPLPDHPTPSDSEQTTTVAPLGLHGLSWVLLPKQVVRTELAFFVKAGIPFGAKMTCEDEVLKLSELGSEDTHVGTWNKRHCGRVEEIKEGDRVVKFLLVEFGGMTTLAPVSNEVAENLKQYMEYMERQPIGTPPFVPGANELVFELERKPHSTEEVLALVCRELYRFHSWASLVPWIDELAHILVSFALFRASVFEQALHQPFGYTTTEENLIVGVAMYLLVWRPVKSLLDHFLCPLKRKREFWADDSTMEGGYGPDLHTALCAGNGQAPVGNPNPDWLYAMFANPAPGIVERLRNIREKQPEIEKKA